MSAQAGPRQEAWWGDDRALIFLAVEGARVLCDQTHQHLAAPQLGEAAVALGMAGYHLSDSIEPEFRGQLIEAVATHAQEPADDPALRAEEALILATDAIEGARELALDEPLDDEVSAGIEQLQRAVAALVRHLGPSRAAALMLAASEHG